MLFLQAFVISLNYTRQFQLVLLLVQQKLLFYLGLFYPTYHVILSLVCQYRILLFPLNCYFPFDVIRYQTILFSIIIYFLLHCLLLQFIKVVICLLTDSFGYPFLLLLTTVYTQQKALYCVYTAIVRKTTTIYHNIQRTLYVFYAIIKKLSNTIWDSLQNQKLMAKSQKP